MSAAPQRHESLSAPSAPAGPALATVTRLGDGDRALRNATTKTVVFYAAPAILCTLGLLYFGNRVYHWRDDEAHLSAAFFARIFAVCGIVAWSQVVAGWRVGRKNESPETIRRASLQSAAGNLKILDPTDALDLAAGGTDVSKAVDVDHDLPELRAVVAEAARDAGVPVPSKVLVQRAGWSVRAADADDSVVVGSAFLLSASLVELRAELIRHLAQRRSPDRLRNLRRARIATTAALWAPKARGRFGWIRTLGTGASSARQLTKVAELAASQLREDAAAAAARIVGREVVDVASQRAAVSQQLWREHLAGHQRAWTADGRPVTPHWTWRSQWARQHPSRTVVAAPTDVIEPVDAEGWRFARDTPHLVPPLAPYCALESLAGQRGHDLLARLDQGAADQYAQPQLSEAFGATAAAAAVRAPAPAPAAEPAVHRSPAPAPAPHASPTLIKATASPAAPAADPVPAQVHAPAPVSALPPVPRSLLDPAELLASGVSATPYSDFILGQLTALRDAMVRRDLAALALGQALDNRNHAPTVQLLAAGVRWLSGDPYGAHALIAAMERVPRATPVLIELSPALRAAGQNHCADAITYFEGAVEAALGQPIRLTGVWDRGPTMTPLVAPPVVVGAIAEVVATMRGAGRAWLVESAPTQNPVRPTVLVIRNRRWYLASSRASEVKQREAKMQTIRAFWPATIVRKYEATSRSEQRLLRRTFPDFWVRPRRWFKR